MMKLSIPSLITALALSACGGSTGTNYGAASAPSPAAGPPAGASGAGSLVKTAFSPKLGATVLVDASGMTLYRLSGERSGRFICSSATCLKAWHPLVAAGGTPHGAVSSLGTTSRPGIGNQITYRGMPLYTFAQDSRAGQVNGQGLRDVGVWNAVRAAAKPAGAPVAPAPATSAPAPAPPTSSGGGGYGY